jgi:hypothetical protein
MSGRGIEMLGGSRNWRLEKYQEKMKKITKTIGVLNSHKKPIELLMEVYFL